MRALSVWTKSGSCFRMEPAAAVYFVCSLCVIEFARKAIFRRSRSGPGNLLAQIVDRKQRRCPKIGSLTRKAVTTYVSDKTIEKIIKLLRCAFKQAVR